jgi:hypothetical protein
MTYHEISKYLHKSKAVRRAEWPETKRLYYCAGKSFSPENAEPASLRAMNKEVFIEPRFDLAEECGARVRVILGWKLDSADRDANDWEVCK